MSIGICDDVMRRYVSVLIEILLWIQQGVYTNLYKTRYISLSLELKGKIMSEVVLFYMFCHLCLTLIKVTCKLAVEDLKEI